MVTGNKRLALLLSQHFISAVLINFSVQKILWKVGKSQKVFSFSPHLEKTEWTLNFSHKVKKSMASDLVHLKKMKIPSEISPPLLKDKVLEC